MSMTPTKSGGLSATFDESAFADTGPSAFSFMTSGDINETPDAAPAVEEGSSYSHDLKLTLALTDDTPSSFDFIVDESEDNIAATKTPEVSPVETKQETEITSSNPVSRNSNPPPTSEPSSTEPVSPSGKPRRKKVGRARRPGAVADSTPSTPKAEEVQTKASPTSGASRLADTKKNPDLSRFVK